MSGHQLEQQLMGLRNMIGNTPLLAISLKYRGQNRVVFAKAENLNMTGSIKDRMALHIMGQARARGTVQPGALVVEATSGNTGIAFAAIGRALGHTVAIYMPNWMSREQIDLISSLGAEIVLVTKEQGGFVGSIQMAEERAERIEGAFLPQQFSNEDNIAAHAATTGPEIWWQLSFHHLRPDAFVAGVGTGGTIMGVGRYLRQQRPGVKLYPVEPANSPTLTTGHKVGKHRIQGISDEFIPDIVDLEYLDEIIAVDDGDAILMAQRLASRLGLGVGISSGANIIAALKVQEKLGPDAVVVTVLPDDNKKYLSTDLLRDEAEGEGFISSDVELLSYQSVKRVCHTCCVPEECGHLLETDLPRQEPDSLLCPRGSSCS